MSDYDELPFGEPTTPPTMAGEPTPRKCRRHVWVRIEDSILGVSYRCQRCTVLRDETRSRRGRTSRNYGNRAELAVARKYGGTKIGQAGGPVDVRGKDFNTQVKTHRRPVPAEWRRVFGALEASGERCPRLLLRFVQGSGIAPVDYFVFPADAFLDWFGRDE